MRVGLAVAASIIAPILLSFATSERCAKAFPYCLRQVCGFFLIMSCNESSSLLDPDVIVCKRAFYSDIPLTFLRFDCVLSILMAAVLLQTTWNCVQVLVFVPMLVDLDSVVWGVVWGLQNMLHRLNYTKRLEHCLQDDLLFLKKDYNIK